MLNRDQIINFLYISSRTRNTELYCIAYEDLAAELYQKWKENVSEPLICVLSEWRVTHSNRECFVICILQFREVIIFHLETYFSYNTI